MFANSRSNYTVHTEVYEGPLDLLLSLIVKAELDITRLSLAKVTDEYITYLSGLQHTSAFEVSGFIVVASKLVQIKSESLLPRPPERYGEEEDPAESLARQLKVYRAIKFAARYLQELEKKKHHTYIRLAPPPKIDEALDLSGVKIDDLIELLKALYHFQEDAAPITTVITIPRVTIKNKIRDIILRLRAEDALSYKQLLAGSIDRIEAIVLFLAVLELIKQQYVNVEQQSLFADINLTSTERAFIDDEITLALDA